MKETMPVLPKSSKALGETFRNGRAPEIGEFRGEYAVRMLTMLPSLHRFGHRKRFAATDHGVIGKNILFRGFGWGSFVLEEAVVPGTEALKAVRINYDVPENSRLTRRIRDLVRAVDGERLYLGRFNLLIRGRLRFLGFFSLAKIEEAADKSPEQGGSR